MVLKKQEKINQALLALDVGTKRVGVAYLASGLNIPLPLEIADRAQGRAEKQIIELCGHYSTNNVLVGLPRGLNNEINPQCEDVLRFCKRLIRRKTDLKLFFIDEYLSSAEIEDRVNVRGKSMAKKGRARKHIDSLVAAMFIEEYLENPLSCFTLDLDTVDKELS